MKVDGLTMCTGNEILGTNLSTYEPKRVPLVAYDEINGEWGTILCVA